MIASVADMPVMTRPRRLVLAVLVAADAVATTAGCDGTSASREACRDEVQRIVGPADVDFIGNPVVAGRDTFELTGYWDAGQPAPPGGTIFTCVTDSTTATVSTTIPRDDDYAAPAPPSPAPCLFEGCIDEDSDAPPVDARACVIKGNVSFNTGERIYHVPGQAYYEETVVNEAYGERWFCTEDEAIAAGWRKSLM